MVTDFQQLEEINSKLVLGKSSQTGDQRRWCQPLHGQWQQWQEEELTVSAGARVLLPRHLVEVRPLHRHFIPLHEKVVFYNT